MIKVDRDRVELLDQHSSERSFMVSQISQKIEKHRPPGLVIIRGDMVREVGGEQKHCDILTLTYLSITTSGRQRPGLRCFAQIMLSMLPKTEELPMKGGRIQPMLPLDRHHQRNSTTTVSAENRSAYGGDPTRACVAS